MAPDRAAETVAGEASSEEDVVFLDGPDGVAVTMTPEAARGTAESLKAAADESDDHHSARR